MASRKSLEYTRKKLILLKFLGFSSLTIVNGKSVTKPFDILCFLLALSCGFVICYFAIVNRESLSTSKSEIADYGNFIMLIASICVSMLSMCFSFIFRHKIWSMLLETIGVEDKVNIFTVHSFPQYLNIFMSFCISV